MQNANVFVKIEDDNLGMDLFEFSDGFASL